MSLLTDASLLLTPNANKEGKLYSIIPSNGNGDFTATRATTATRVNSAGLVDLVPYNLVGYSEMFTDASWTKSNVTISANSISAPNGTLTADTLTGNGISGSHGVLNGFTPVISTTYTLSCYVKANTNNFVQITAAASAFGSSFFANFDIVNGTIGSYGATALNPSIENVGSGWYRISVSGVALTGSNVGAIGIYLVSSNSAVRLETNTLSTSVYIWGAQLVEGTSARDYLRTETRLNIPRRDYSLGSCPNILLEPQRTNLALQSASFEVANWTKNGTTITLNSTTSPSGVLDADTITRDGTSQFNPLAQAISVTTGTAYTFSVYAKKGTNNFIQIFAATALFTSNFFANFDLNTGVVGSVGSASTASIQDAGNGWYRCIITGTATGTGSSNAFSISLVTSSTAARGQSNTLTTSVFLWGAQVEAGAFSTSYIPTTTASVTRNTDVITRNNIFTNGLITASGGTWFIELRNNIALTRDGGGNSVIFLGDSSTPTTGNCFRLWSGTSSRFIVQKVVASIATQLFVTTANTCKLAIKWNGTTADIFENGVKVVSATAFTATALENLFGGGAQTTAYVNEMALFPTPLTDAQCLALTA